jgi:hypothetical protein
MPTTKPYINIKSLLGLIALLAFASGVAVVWKTLGEYDGLSETYARHSKMLLLRSKIEGLDEILTSSALLATTTEDRRWIDKYDRHVPELDIAIRELKDLDATGRPVAETVDAANIELVRMEKAAFARLAERRPKDAAAILSSAAYAENKRAYAEGIN